MTIKVGCFALVDPFSLLDHQLERVAGLGFKYADVTDNHPGGILAGSLASRPPPAWTTTPRTCSTCSRSTG